MPKGLSRSMLSPGGAIYSCSEQSGHQTPLISDEKKKGIILALCYTVHNQVVEEKI